MFKKISRDIHMGPATVQCMLFFMEYDISRC